jgi:hypothetical protein
VLSNRVEPAERRQGNRIDDPVACTCGFRCGQCRFIRNIDPILHTIQAKTRRIFQSKSAHITSIGATPHLICLIRHLLHPFLDFLWDFRVPAIEYAALVLTS